VQGDLNTIWRELESLERRIAAPAPHDAHHGPDWFDDWRARLDRVLRVRSALSQSGSLAHRLLAERLSGIDLSVVGEILLSACKDIALVWGASILLGGAAGALIGFFGLGVGALPGAAAGAAFGTQAGAWVLGFLGLKALIEDLGTAIPDALRHYELGFKLAWGPVRRWEQDEGTHRAPYELAEGHLVLMMAMLSALMAYLTRGRGDPGAKARILQEIRQSPRLGPKVADWVVANEDKLTRHPSLKPKGQQVMMSQAKPPAGPPATPSQLQGRPAAGQPAPPPEPRAGAAAKNAPAVGGAGQAAQGAASFVDPAERAIAEHLEGLGRKVSKNPLEGAAGAGRQGDAFVDDVLTEFKTLDPGASAGTIKNTVNNSIRNGGQAREIVVDARGTGLAEDAAKEGAAKALGISRGKLDGLMVIGDGYSFRWTPR
jgi:hypothetical protein